MKEKYISRVDSYKSGMFGYLLRLYRNNSVLFQEWFSDKDYGSKDRALQAAMEARKRKMKAYNYIPGGDSGMRQWKPVLQTRDPKSNTGILGISKGRDLKKNENGEVVREYPYFQVNYVEEKGKRKTKKFYITKKRDRKEALKQAKEFRSAKEVSARMAAVEHNREIARQLVEEENIRRKELEKKQTVKRK